MSEAEQNALVFLRQHGGSVLVTQVHDVSGKDVFGAIIPGLRIYSTLEKKGLLYITVEEPDAEGFTFTPMIELTQSGLEATHKI